MIKIKDAKKEYSTASKVVVKALDGVSLEFPNTGLIFVCGESGSGKSTLLNCIAGLDKLTSGDVYVNWDKSLSKMSWLEMDSYRNSCVGFIFQEFNLLEKYTVGQNVEIALGMLGKVHKPKSNELLTSVGLNGYYKRKINELGGGQKQRVAIARAIAKSPQIILADEPTGSLDSKTGGEIFDLFVELSKTRLVIIVSHDRESAIKYGDRVIELKDGKVAADNAKSSQSDSVQVQEKIILKKSQISFARQLKMGGGAILKKKVRIFFSILLPTVMLALFLLGITAADLDKVELREMYKQGISMVIVNKTTSQQGIGFSEFTEKKRFEDSQINNLYSNGAIGNVLDAPVILLPQSNALKEANESVFLQDITQNGTNLFIDSNKDEGDL